MSWGDSSNDRGDEALAHFHGLASAGLAHVCQLIVEIDARQSWMTDGARGLVDWVAARLRLRHATAAQLVGVVRRLQELPVLSARFASGDLSL
ncbi:MAG: DUF222 domain-containing protein, partial [Actinobacteria bacterium]|nr:DUF222 domain-containing protein [Actinomycetota bacterium]